MAALCAGLGEFLFSESARPGSMPFVVPGGRPGRTAHLQVGALHWALKIQRLHKNDAGPMLLPELMHFQLTVMAKSWGPPNLLTPRNILHHISGLWPDC